MSIVWYENGMSKNPQNPKREPVQVVAIIPARGGQQNIPYKNLQKLGGKTLLQWAIDVALAADLVDAVVVSTEDEKIAAEAAAAGVIVVPRPAEYSQPTSGDAGFYHHAVEWLEKEHGWQPELLINLRPTGPLRFPADVDAMVRYMQDHPEADGVKSVIPAPIHPYKMWQFEEPKEIGGAGKLKPVFDNEFRQTHGPDQPRQKIQELFPVYWQDAQIDITRRQFVLRPATLANDNVWGPNIHGYVLDPRTSADLDTAEDFRRAEKIYKDLQAEKD
jgi:CMP-N,N'-diacetyllegionaminic acid synthase